MDFVVGSCESNEIDIVSEITGNSVKVLETLLYSRESSRETTPDMEALELIKKKKRRRARHRKRGINTPKIESTPEPENISINIKEACVEDAISTQDKAIGFAECETKEEKNKKNSAKQTQSRLSPPKFGCDNNKLEQNVSIKGQMHNDRKAGKARNNESWLDFSLEEEESPAVEIERPTEAKAGKNIRENNVQLDAYKSRFTFSKNDAVSLDACEKGDAVKVRCDSWNNEKAVARDAAANKIGVNVNALGKKFDGTKRSRRKTEPFDFAEQSDGVVGEPGGAKREPVAEHTAWEIPNNLCSFLSETAVENKRSLFSGSAAAAGEAGLAAPAVMSECESAVRDSLQKIFDDDYDFECSGSDDGSDCESGSDDVDFESDDEAVKSDGVLLPPEPQIGNVEYKLKLVKPSKQRFEHLVTQMKWRLREGRGEAVYGVGVRDCGRVRGLRAARLRASLRTLRRMAARLGARCALLAVLPAPPRYTAEVLVRKIPDDQHNIELRVAVMGSNDAGKSTLVGVLTQGELDNGRGSARLNMFRHLHEVRTGRTSSVSHEALGFDSQGRPINYAYSDLITPEEILEKSSKLVSFIDLAGHRKYLKTTVQGLTGYSPHLAMLVVSATAGVNRMTLEHLELVRALDLPFFIVITKTDQTPPNTVLQRLRQELATLGCRKVPLQVQTRDDVVLSASNMAGRLLVPVFPVSSVSGGGLDALRWFLFLTPSVAVSSDCQQEPVEFQVDETFKVGDSSGPVVAGLLTKGVITERTELLIGPLDSGEFIPIRVESLHRNKVPCRVVRAGQAASLGLARAVPGLRQGMVLLAVPGEQRPRGAAGARGAVSREAIMSAGAWNSEKVSPKACKKLRKRLNGTRGAAAAPGPRAAEEALIHRLIEDIDCKDARDSEPNLIGGVAPLSLDKFAGTSENEASAGRERDGGNEMMFKKESDSTIFQKNEDKIFEEDPDDPRGCFFFQASVSVLHNSTAIYPGFQATVHIGSIRQTAVIEGILSSRSVLGAGERASVLFRFLRHPEYVRCGSGLLLRQALHAKGIGRVTQAFPHRPV